MTMEGVRAYLQSVDGRPAEPSPEMVQEALVRLKSAAVSRGDQAEAKTVWCLEQALQAQNLYLQAFAEMKKEHFYEAWCMLEQAELALLFLERHDTASWPLFRLDFIREHVGKWQRLFPYKIFISPELVEHEKLCSICRQPVRPRSPCGHRVGEIYNGEMCTRVVTRVEPIAMSLVDKPVQKYSVPFLSDSKSGERRDQYNYGIVRYAISALRSPFDTWDAVWTKKRQPHSRFRHIGRNDPCPCESGRKYKKCCLPEPGVLRPHLAFVFGTPPPAGIPSEIYFP
jgi:hypothetical protein